MRKSVVEGFLVDQQAFPCGETAIFRDPQEVFTAEKLVYDSTLRNLELIGEAATHIPHEVREVHLEIEWRDIIGTRNQLAHIYLGIDDDVIWDIIQADLPNLLPKLHNLLNTTKEDSV